MTSITIYLALGTNLGDRLGNLQTAIKTLPPAVPVLAQSPIYETRPWGMLNQPDFLNMVIRAETELSPLDLLVYLKNLEMHLGRLPSIHYGPRKIDLDILFYDDIRLHKPGLTIPHPGLQERAFVLVPLADLVPDLIHPISGKTVRAMLAELDSSGVKRYGSGF